MIFTLTTLEDYSDESLLSELRRVADSLNGQRLTIDKFNSLAHVNSSTLTRRFGSWGTALDKAGISEATAPRSRNISREDILQSLRFFSSENPGQTPTVKIIADHLGVSAKKISRHHENWDTLLAEVAIIPFTTRRRYTDEECFENILQLWTKLGRQPKFDELKRPPSVVGSKAYITRWGGWRAALSAFVKTVNSPNEIQPEHPPKIVSAASNYTPPDSAPRSLNLALRYKVLVRDNFRCVICGASPAKDGSVELHVDHIFPWSRGGQNIEDNLRTLCSKCNLGKGSKIESEI